MHVLDGHVLHVPRALEGMNVNQLCAELWEF